jgi:hypothetical protein
VTAWRDKSGSGYTAVPHSGTIAQTTLNGQNALNFGTSVMRVPSFTWTSSFTQIFVAYASLTGGIIIDTMNAAATQYGDYVFTGNGGLMNVNNPANTGILQVYDSVAGPVQPNNTWFIFSIGYGSTGTVAINYTLNGTVRSTTLINGAGGSATNPPLTLYINGVPSTTLGSGVQIAELIHFNTDITTPQRQQVEGYLAAKWGLKANLPPTHPYSAVVSVPFNRPFYPTDIPGCSLWLDAADRSSMTFSSGSLTNISGWNDKSGAENNATGSTTPYPQYNIKTLNGLPVIGLEASTDQFFVNNNFTVTTFPTITYACVFSWNGNSGSDPIGGIITTDTPGSYGRSLGISNQIIQIENYNSFTATSSTLSLGQFYTVVVTFNGATEMTVSVNGVKSTYAGSTGSFNNTGGLFIGNYYGNSASYGTNMDIAELLIYGTALSTAQRQQVEQYLAWKWGLVANLPPGHPGLVRPAFGVVSGPPSVAYLVVGGGGGGGCRFGGGGGAGGFLTGALSVLLSTSYTVTVGEGGTKGAASGGGGQQGAANGGQGGSSVFSSVTALGGSGGAAGDTGSGLSGGGSGGGGAGRANSRYPYGFYTSGGTGTSGQGNNGAGSSYYTFCGGGGGGAGAAGAIAVGGAGKTSSITGTLVTYAGGGGGGGSADPSAAGSNENGGAGGAGGGGAGGPYAGGSTTATAGTPNTGGGGGGGAYNTDFNLGNQPGADGGSGIVVVAYPSTYNPLSYIDAGLTYEMYNNIGKNIIYIFKSGTGTIKWKW